MPNHPNATVAASGSGTAILIVWLLGLLGVDIGAEVGAAIAGATATGLLFIGRNGLKGLMRIVWQGS